MMREFKSLEIQFPAGGLVMATSLRNQPPNTTVDCLNVRAYERFSGRNRGSQREGIAKYCPSLVNSTNPIQSLNSITATYQDLYAGNTIRSNPIIAVAGGKVAKLDTTGVTAVTGGAGALSALPSQIFSAKLFNQIFYVDGYNFRIYDAPTNSITNWLPSAGALPRNGFDTPCLIESWRGRIVVSGIQTDSQNWFMSAQGDATNWNYSPVPTQETMAVAGNCTKFGTGADPIRSIIPVSDQLIYFGCDHSLWQMTGDPASDGRMDIVSEHIGTAYGRPWCVSPEGVVYFMGSRGSVYELAPGNQPKRMTASTIDPELFDIDLSRNAVRMVWNDREMGFHLFITPYASATTTHYYYDVRNQSWWRDRYDTNGQNPYTVHLFDGDGFADRQILLGCNDGYVRKISQGATNDDGTAINSYVWLGPIQIEDGTIPFVLSELQAVLGADSDSVNFDVFVGNGAESAKQPDSVLTGFLLGDGSHLITTSANFSGTFLPLRSFVSNPRTRALACYVRLRNSTLDKRWTLETLRARLNVASTSKRRKL